MPPHSHRTYKEELYRGFFKHLIKSLILCNVVWFFLDICKFILIFILLLIITLQLVNNGIFSCIYPFSSILWLAVWFLTSPSDKSTFIIQHMKRKFYKFPFKNYNLPKEDLTLVLSDLRKKIEMCLRPLTFLLASRKIIYSSRHTTAAS